ncbi:MAG: hypothetical protein WED09_03055 [Homoserinimonas sp.]
MEPTTHIRLSGHAGAFALTLVTGGFFGLVYLALLLTLPPVRSVEDYHRPSGTPQPTS